MPVPLIYILQNIKKLKNLILEKVISGMQLFKKKSIKFIFYFY